ncbi:MAG: MerR family transcriptional regulator [Myxococcales bacterium]|nr:MerR family transcriptional regulator [Myxococcales bacterium]
MTRPSKLLTTGDMARLSNNTVRTVRFYEETGVLEPAHRSEGGHRLFPATELDKLILVTAMRNAGLSLEEIKLLLGSKEGHECGAEASGRVIAMLEKHIAAMTEKIAVLSRLRSEFQRAAERLGGCLSCHDRQHFPKHCGDCAVMQGAGVPLSVQVLWQLDSASRMDDEGTGKTPR